MKIKNNGSRINKVNKVYFLKNMCKTVTYYSVYLLLYNNTWVPKFFLFL